MCEKVDIKSMNSQIVGIVGNVADWPAANITNRLIRTANAVVEKYIFSAV